MSCDGLGDYDWSDMAQEEPVNHGLLAVTGHNFALMAHSSSSSSGSDSEVSNESDESTCSFKSCADTVEELKTRIDNLTKEVEFLRVENIGYKVGIANVERKLEYMQELEIEYVDRIDVQRGEIDIKNAEIEMFKRKLVESEQARDLAIEEKEKHIIRVDKQKYATSVLDGHDKNIIECQLMRKNSGIGYNEVPPPKQSALAPPGK